MRYSTSVLMKVMNALFEFILIILSYLFSSFLRVIIPLGKTYEPMDTWTFFPVGILFATVLTVGYFLSGCYNTLRHCSVKKELYKMGIISFVSTIIVTSVLFVFRLNQFSRILLLIFLVVSFLIIFIKRQLFAYISEHYAEKLHLDDFVIIYGSGCCAEKIYKSIQIYENESWKYVGYIADTPNDHMIGYLGKKKLLKALLEKEKIDRIVIAEDEQDLTEMKDVLTIAQAYGVNVSILPVFHEFLSSKEHVHFVSGIKLLDLELLTVNNIMGVNIAVTNMEKTLSLIEEHLEEWKGKYICVSNVHTTVTSHEDRNYCDIQNEAVMALPDGGPLSQFSRELKYLDAERVTGPDLMREVLKMSGEKGWRNYFYGSSEETLQKMCGNIKLKYGGNIVTGAYSPPFRKMTLEEDEEIIRKINAENPDFLWVGLGAPKQEIWMHEHQDKIHALMIGVGAAFDYEAGNIQRAPEWMQKNNLEWLYRFCQNPRKLFKRYLITNTKFMIWKWRQ